MQTLFIVLYPFIKLFNSSRKQKVIKRGSLFIALAKLAILKRLHKSTKEVTLRIGPYFLTSPGYTALSFLLKEKFVDEQYFFEETNIKPVIFDCGSSIGISVLYFKCLYPQSEIYSFEPNPTAFNYLEKNIRNNNLVDVQCYKLALSSKKDSIDFFISMENPFINSKTYNIDKRKNQRIAVHSTCLSEFLLAHREVHLVKIDVEGSELDILEDLEKEVLKKRIVKKFIIEYHTTIHPAEISLDKFVTSFSNCGYSFTFLDTGSKNASDKLLLFSL